MLALGAFIVLLTGGIDLSTGVSGIVIASMLSRGAGLPLALAVGLATIVGIGAINGALVTVFRVPAFIATLATMSGVQGVSLLLATRGVYVLSDPSLKQLGTGRLGGVPVSVIASHGVVALAYVLMHHTRFGLRVYATGSDAAAAALANVSTSSVQLLAFVTASCFTFLAATMLIARTPIVTPNLGGQSLLLDAIAACVLGGLGASVKRLRSPLSNKENLWATFGKGLEGGFVLSGHIDVVPAAGQSWTRPPFSLTREPGKVYGRGTTDMKGFVACVMAAASRINLLALARSVHVAITFDEEVGCLGARELVAFIRLQGCSRKRSSSASRPA